MFSTFLECPEYRDIEITGPKTIKHAFPMFCTLLIKTYLFDQSERAQGPIYITVPSRYVFCCVQRLTTADY